MPDNPNPTSESGQPEIPSPENPMAPPSPDPVAVPWQPHIPKEYQDAPLWEPVKDQPLSTVLKGYAEAQKRLGSSIVIPNKEDPEALGKFYNKLGRPEAPESYAWDAPEHTDVTWDEDALKDLRQQSHTLGLSQDQFKGVLDWYSSRLINEANETSQKDMAEHQAAEDALKKEHGTNYEFHKNLGVRAAQEYFGEEIAQEMSEILTSNPGLFNGLLKLGRELNEAGTFGSVSAADFGGLTYESAQAKIQEINAADKGTHPYWNANHPDHDKWVVQVLKYFQVPAPGSRP